VITAGLLPERLRAAYGLGWGRTDRALFAAARTAIPRLVAAAPEGLRVVPLARAAERRKAA
jgi:uncharacterized protein (DUF2236 family)